MAGSHSDITVRNRRRLRSRASELARGVQLHMSTGNPPTKVGGSLGRAALLALCVSAIVLGVTTSAIATRVSDVTHLKGRRQNTLTGYGLVVGLPGTGDGGKYAPAILQLQSVLEKFHIPVPYAELKNTKNVAIVNIEATLPENGVREGDRVDVRVSSSGSAKNLYGGVLIPTPLQGPGLDEIFAFASGPIRLTDPKIKTSGIIAGGATMEADVVHNYIVCDEQTGAYEITLVLEDVHASAALAAVIAEMINETASEICQVRKIARAADPKNVVVQIPGSEMADPFGFVARIESTELLMPQGEARIVINRKTETIIVGDGVEIGPAVIAHGGMTITTVRPSPKPTIEEPAIGREHAVLINAPEQNRRGTKLRDVVDALNKLNVPAKDIIQIIEELYRSGKVRGKLVIQE